MRLFLSLLAAAVLSSGCATTAMKGTPFFTGEHAKREGPAENRVNLWPIAYYRAPALSILWPIGEFSDDRFAIRPLFSMYRDGEDEPWHEWNWLGGLYSVDEKNQRCAAFPFFWGRNYFNVFPLFWSGSDPGDGSSHDILFPVWIRNRSAFDPDCRSDRFFLFLAGNRRGKGVHEHWAAPFYYARSNGSGDLAFFSLPWAAKNDDWRSVPLLLSAWAPDGEWGRVLLGLGGWNETSSWGFPLWYQDSATGEFLAPLCYRNPRTGVFVSPLWASKEGSWRAVPPLLSWWNPDGSGRALLGLAGWDDSRSWAIPLWYRDSASDTLVTPLWAHQAGRWSAVPPLLSWRSADAATGASSLYLLGGLAGATPDAHWFAPLYFRDGKKDRFFSPLYASGRNWHAIPLLLAFWDWYQFLSPFYVQDPEGGAIPPLLTWWDGDGLRVLLGLGGSGGSRDWAIPFYWRDTAADAFFSPVWAHGREWNAAPPLLSAWRRDGRAGIVLLGLGGWFEDLRCDWCFPLWLAGDGAFYSLPYSKWTKSGTTYRTFATILAGWKSGREEGWWFLPFFGFTRYRDQERFRYNWLLLGGGNVSPSASSHWFAPLFEDRSDVRVAPLRAEMEAPRLPRGKRVVETNAWTRAVPAAAPGASAAATAATNVSVRYVDESGRSGTTFLLGLAGTSHETKLNPRPGDLPVFSGKDGASPGGGETGRFLHPPEAASPDAVARYLATDENWFFPLWSGKRRRAAMFGAASGEKRFDAGDEAFSFLFFLYDWKRESIPGENHEYARRRVLWRLYHHEELNGDESTDVFPAITWDRRKDGYRKASFLWRLFRWERDPAKGTSLDILFIPIRRP